MKKILIVTVGLIVGVVVVGIVAEQLFYGKMGSIVGEYDKATEEQIAAGDFEAAYYQLNRLHNRFATFTGGQRILRSGHLKWIYQRLENRRGALLSRLAEEMPGGVAGDWSTVEQLEDRYLSFQGQRIAMLNKDKHQRKMTSLTHELRGAGGAAGQAMGLLPERSPAATLAADTASGQKKENSRGEQHFADRHRAIMETAKRRTDCARWQQWSQMARVMRESLQSGEKASVNAPWGGDNVLLTSDNGDELEGIIARNRPEDCGGNSQAATAGLR